MKTKKLFFAAGEISDEDISLFERVIKSNSQNLLNTKQQISYKQDY